MAQVNCPNCSATLKIPDGSAAAIRCPKCKTVFRPPAPQPAFEVVDEKPAPPKAAPKPPPKPAPKLAVKPPPKPASEFEEVDDEPAPPPKKKKVAVEADDYDDAPPKRRREDDEDEDDRPQSRRFRDDDEEDEDDRPRKKKKKRRRDYGDDGGRRSVGPARTGLMLLSVSLWLYGGAVALLAFYLFLGWVGVGLGYGVFVVPGIVGMANWVVAIVGIGMCISNPRVRGLAIAAVCVAVVHLGLTFYDATDTGTRTRTETTQGPRGQQTTTTETSSKGGQLHGLFAAMAMKGMFEEQAARMKELDEKFKSGRGDPQQMIKELEAATKEMAEAGKSWQNPSLYWEDFGTMLPLLDGVGSELIYNSKHLGDHALGLLAAACELARLILILLLVGAVAEAGGASYAAGKTRIALLAAVGAALACAVVALLYSVIIHESKPSGKFWGHLGIMMMIVFYLAHAGAALISGVVTNAAKNDVE